MSPAQLDCLKAHLNGWFDRLEGPSDTIETGPDSIAESKLGFRRTLTWLAGVAAAYWRGINRGTWRKINAPAHCSWASYPRCDASADRCSELGGLPAGAMTVTGALGLKRSEVVVAPYDPRWPGLFEEAAAELVAALGSSLLAVHHVGSTAVPGLPAKPILDLLVSVADLDGAVQMVPQLGALGYEFRPGEEIPDRHYFRRPPGGDVRTHHLSLAEPTSWHHRAALAFRDALRRDSELSSAYAELKKNLASRFPSDRSAYIEGKSQFISDALSTEGSHRGGAPAGHRT